MAIKNNNFIKNNSPDGVLNHTVQGKGFLQSEQWRRFQEATGKKTFIVGNNNISIIEHNLPVAGKYFYVPRGVATTKQELNELIKLAEENANSWIRVEPKDKQTLGLVQELAPAQKIWKAPHDMQPRELFIIDITKSEEELLAEMKSKTRYNIRLAQKRGVKIFTSKEEKYFNKFYELIRTTSKRDNIVSHPENYYREMLETIPDENIKLYLAEYQGPASTRDDATSTRDGKVIAANIVAFYSDTATYLHGASDNEYRNVMAPHLLQWQEILDAKKAGYKKYDFGGIKTNNDGNSWKGITRFKTGFSPSTEPTEFPGSYDIVLNSGRYSLYRFLQKIKSFL